MSRTLPFSPPQCFSAPTTRSASVRISQSRRTLHLVVCLWRSLPSVRFLLLALCFLSFCRGHLRRTCPQQLQVEKKDIVGLQEQIFVRKVIELHDKFMAYVNDCFLNHTLFHKALKEAIEVFCNKGVSGSSSAELLATFCDNILKKSGSEKLLVLDSTAYIHVNARRGQATDSHSLAERDDEVD